MRTIQLPSDTLAACGRHDSMKLARLLRSDAASPRKRTMKRAAQVITGAVVAVCLAAAAGVVNAQQFPDGRPIELCPEGRPVRQLI